MGRMMTRVHLRGIWTVRRVARHWHWRHYTRLLRRWHLLCWSRVCCGCSIFALVLFLIVFGLWLLLCFTWGFRDRGIWVVVGSRRTLLGSLAILFCRLIRIVFVTIFCFGSVGSSCRGRTRSLRWISMISRWGSTSCVGPVVILRENQKLKFRIQFKLELDENCICARPFFLPF